MEGHFCIKKIYVVCFIRFQKNDITFNTSGIENKDFLFRNQININAYQQKYPYISDSHLGIPHSTFIAFGMTDAPIHIHQGVIPNAVRNL